MSLSKAIPANEVKLVQKPEEAGFSSSQLEVLDSHIVDLINKKQIFAGAYLISKNDRIIAHKAIGYAMYDNSRPFLPDTIRRVASVTKLFVAVSIMQLAEKGKLRLDQPVSDIIEEFRNPMYEKVNITHLLTHTSGIRPDPGQFFEPYPLDWSGGKEWLKDILRGLPVTRPGEEYRYSSAGFAVLGEIVSRVSGVRFENYVIENITKPLGMTDSCFDPPEEALDRICFGSREEKEWFDKDRKKARPKWAPPRGGGGLFSTLSDLRKFGQMMINKGTYGGVKILSRKTVEAMTRRHVYAKNYCWGNGGVEMEYGLGMNVYSNNTFLSPGSFSHEGAGLCGLYMDPVENVVLAYICPLCEGLGWSPEAVINLRNIVWAGIV
ncbi:MAG TPA: serine hydrolase domain-containing protein [Clostridia bacterium]|nr:serine hydrolase domain-containing protein [Clostridia bacterium]